jgi:hypothetical protein
MPAARASGRTRSASQPRATAQRGRWRSPRTQHHPGLAHRSYLRPNRSSRFAHGRHLQAPAPPGERVRGVHLSRTGALPVHLLTPATTAAETTIRDHVLWRGDGPEWRRLTLRTSLCSQGVKSEGVMRPLATMEMMLVCSAGFVPPADSAEANARPAPLEVIASIPTAAVQIAFGNGALWALGDGELVRIDPLIVRRSTSRCRRGQADWRCWRSRAIVDLLSANEPSARVSPLRPFTVSTQPRTR